MENLKRIGVFLALFLFVVGAGCALGWLGYHKEWFAFVAELIVIGFGIPTFIYLLKTYILEQ